MEVALAVPLHVDLDGPFEDVVRLDVRHPVQWNLKRKQAHATDQESELEPLNDERERRVSRHTYTSTLDNTGNTILVCYVLLMSSRPVPQKQDVSILCTSYVGDMPCLVLYEPMVEPRTTLDTDATQRLLFPLSSLNNVASPNFINPKQFRNCTRKARAELVNADASNGQHHPKVRFAELDNSKLHARLQWVWRPECGIPTAKNFKPVPRMNAVCP